ncbi:MAG TPA: outer membrane protein assembly factor BamE [Gammaproteobacteria bacterium]|nr:outer membrane protein assembly factor BamE [Gammaproteobacteria bacterium]
MNQTSRPLHHRLDRLGRVSLGCLALIAAAFLSSGCVYRMDVQQGNLVDPANLAKVDVGMTRSQVQFLLGTPMIADSFHQNRWDYPYYLRMSRGQKVRKSWFIVYFKDDRVVRIDRNPDNPERVQPAKATQPAAPDKQAQS